MLLHSFLTEQKIDWCEGIEAGRNESAKRGVIVGLGISFIPTNTITASVEKGRLEVLDLASTSLDRHWYLMRLQKKTNSSEPFFGNFLKQPVGTPSWSPKETSLTSIL